MIRFVVVIPARYASERLPGKPLRDIAGKPMLRYVHEKGLESDAGQVIIATDDRRVADAAEAFGATVMMTSEEHGSGTERLAEVARYYDWPTDMVIVNLQGDEPLMPAQLINQCAALLVDNGADIGTLASPIASQEDFENPNVVKVVVDDDGCALYFSRAMVPYAREVGAMNQARGCALHHHGIYAYRYKRLQDIVTAKPSRLEVIEKLEQLRALSLGLRIKVGVPATPPGPSVDTEDDLAAVESLLS